MKTVLFVDDDPDFLKVMVKAFQLWSKGAFQADSADSVGAALVKLESMSVDLVVSDLNMPVIDGVQFLRLLGRKYPQVHKIMLTGYASDPDVKNCSASGAELILEKPKNHVELDNVFQALKEILESAEPGKADTLKQANLKELLELFCNGGATLILEIASKDLSGKVFVEKGAIIHAETNEGSSGIEAFRQLMALTEGDYQILAYESPPKVSITESWQRVLKAADSSEEE